ncbi:hypothetical protein K4L44_13405 [Halosquirtibacter laminarini]|uniref:Uncharacterized protein n=1 Tax=Halosquirtibacter laminarini TaxID=3374600 RepID=A0AC61NN66_9BACT|nr:hypothetical protein K4L44_13405 [Prolixibacteraceae bacterium]
MKLLNHLSVICLALFVTSCISDDFKPKSIAETSMTMSLQCDMEKNNSLVQIQFFNDNNYTTELVGGNKITFENEVLPYDAYGSRYALYKQDKTIFQGVFSIEGDNGQTYKNIASINMCDVWMSVMEISAGDPLTITWDVELVADESMSVYIYKDDLTDDGNTSGQSNINNQELVKSYTVDDDGATSLTIKGGDTQIFDEGSRYKVVCVRTLLTNKIDQAPPLGGQMLTKLFLPHMNLLVKKAENNEN